MKIALIGYGRMGHMIEEIAVSRGHEIVCTVDVGNPEAFDSEAFRSADVAIEFSMPSSAYSNVRKAFDIRDALSALGFTTYLRVTHSEVVADGEIRDVWRPMLSNLIFVRIRKKIMRELKNTNMLLHALQFYAKVKTEKTKKADIITVSDRDMQKFIDAELREDPMRQRIPLTVGEYLAKPGRPVRICRGPFAGIEGEIKTIKSHRIVVVKIAELGLANGITHVPKEDLEFLVTPSQS